MTNYDRIYQKTIKEVFENGSNIHNERTGYQTKAKPGMTLDLQPADGFPLLTLRKIPIKLFCAEVVWMITGRKKLDFLQKFTRIWDDFSEEDGTVQTAYGYRWRKHFGRDQLLDLVAHLEEEPSSRQGVVVMWDPADDGLTGPKKKNVPCPFCWTANIIDGKLNMHLVIRSNDMMLGSPHDTAGFALLQAMLAQKLGVDVGKLTISISHAHIYENHYDQAGELISRGGYDHPEIQADLPANAFDRALRADEDLVNELFAMFKQQYDPQPPVERMKIAL